MGDDITMRAQVFEKRLTKKQREVMADADPCEAWRRAHGKVQMALRPCFDFSDDPLFPRLYITDFGREVHRIATTETP